MGKLYDLQEALCEDNGGFRLCLNIHGGYRHPKRHCADFKIKENLNRINLNQFYFKKIHVQYIQEMGRMKKMSHL